MTVNKWEKKKKTKIVICFYIVLILLILLTVSTYTWFARSKINRVSNLSIHINTPVGLEIATSPDSEEWVQQLSFDDIVNESSPLRPVTYSAENKQFFGAVYDIDGRLTGRWNPLTDKVNANRDNYDGYYTIATVYARTDEQTVISLAPAVELDGGKEGSGTYLVGVPEWDAESVSHKTDVGAEAAVRIGIKVTRLDEINTPTDEEPLFFIFEPNSDIHIDGSEGYKNTPSIDGVDSLVTDEMLITQSASVWKEADPVQKGVRVYTYGEFDREMDLFSMSANEIVKIDFYIWLEGQDVDCNNMMKESEILANIQFHAESKHNSGLQPIK